jgi:hypothetical protein
MQQDPEDPPPGVASASLPCCFKTFLNIDDENIGNTALESFTPFVV